MMKRPVPQEVCVADGSRITKASLSGIFLKGLRVIKSVAFRFRALARFRKIEPEGLVYVIETDLSKPFVVGKGGVFHLAGRCYHPYRKIRKLNVLANGIPYRVFNHTLARADVLRQPIPPVDRVGNSLVSGFWIPLTFAEIDKASQIDLALQAFLDNGECYTVQIGTLDLLPGQPELPDSSPNDRQCSGDEPLVAICMATFNPPLELFIAQIKSIIEQNHKNWICVINDDCSPQNVYDQILKVVSEDKRFKVSRNSERLGFYHNFERCLERVSASANFVAFSDQDDLWYPEKISSCLEAFETDTALAYCDMDIVTRNGEIISHTYWTTRKNNYTDFTTLLFANTVTGAASVFRASLLRHILPFPKRIGDSFHDHWVACVALAVGKIGYVDKPLYAYRQHSNNVLGHYAPAAMTFFPGFSQLMSWLRSPAGFKVELRSRLWPLNDIYYNDVIRLILIAKTLQIRLGSIAVGKQAILKRLAGFERRVSGLMLECFKYELLRRPTLGAEWYCLRGAIGHRLLNLYCSYNRRRLFRQRWGKAA
ncbi:MAG: glycosyltransferase [Candidatus Competibacteraceae bacterium]|nr:MAG: glycosyltransferase [Candidatus Competibacteraceae bacterium]